MISLPSLLGRAAGAVPGVALGAASGVAAAIRRTKPLHPAGVVGDATVTVSPTSLSGVPFLDTVAEHAAFVRWSRAMGLPAKVSDMEGMAIRLGPESGGPADLLFASTGDGALSRHVLVPRRPDVHGTMTTMLPLDTDRGTLLLRLTPAGPGGSTPGRPPTEYDLSWSRVGGPWHRTAGVAIRWRGVDEAVRFEPVRNLLPGTRQYPFIATLREPAYVASRALSAVARRAR